MYVYRYISCMYVCIFSIISGLQLCFGQPVDIEILSLLRNKVDDLCEVVQRWSLDNEQACFPIFISKFCTSSLQP